MTTQKERRNQWAKDNPDKVKNSYLKWRFGITLEDYNAMSEAQGHTCAICAQPETTTGRSLAVDHCHTTGRIRGLLCTACNVALGKLNDSIERLQSAQAYLLRHA